MKRNETKQDRFGNYSISYFAEFGLLASQITYNCLFFNYSFSCFLNCILLGLSKYSFSCVTKYSSSHFQNYSSACKIRFCLFCKIFLVSQTTVLLVSQVAAFLILKLLVCFFFISQSTVFLVSQIAVFLVLQNTVFLVSPNTNLIENKSMTKNFIVKISQACCQCNGPWPPCRNPKDALAIKNFACTFFCSLVTLPDSKVFQKKCTLF